MTPERLTMAGIFVDVDRLVYEHVKKYFEEHPNVDLLNVTVPSEPQHALEYARGGLIENDGKQKLTPDKPLVLLRHNKGEKAPLFCRAYDYVKPLCDERGIKYLF